MLLKGTIKQINEPRVKVQKDGSQRFYYSIMLEPLGSIYPVQVTYQKKDTGEKFKVGQLVELDVNMSDYVYVDGKSINIKGKLSYLIAQG